MIRKLGVQEEELKRAIERAELAENKLKGIEEEHQVIITTIISIIIITRPKPAYGGQGLVGSWGQYTNQARIFWGILNVSLRAWGAQLGFNQPGTINDNENPPRNLEKPWKPTKTMKNHETTLKNHGNQAKTMKPP